VLSADRGGVAEQVQRSGAGATFAPGDSGSLADVAAHLLGGDLRALGHRGRVYAEREHNWTTVFDRIFGIYRRIIG
jgi:glycosyltransferase involved in cell wall biosynthesis